MIFRRRSSKPEQAPEPTTITPPISEELGPLALLGQKIIKTDLPEEVSNQAENELKKLEKIDEVIITLPWQYHRQ